MAEEGTESYQTINGANQKESELLCLLLFTDSNLLIHFSLNEGLRRRIIGRGAVREVGGPRVYIVGTSKSVTPCLQNIV